MLGRLILLFLLMPAVELGLLIQVDKLIGFWPTIGTIILTGVVGSYLARREGLSVWKRLNDRLNTGDVPGEELLDGVIILVAGALLVTPGVLTDVIGFLGLFPWTRAGIRKVVMNRIQKKMDNGGLQMQFGVFGGGFGAGGPYDAGSFDAGGFESDVHDAEWEPVGSSPDASEQDGQGRAGRNGTHRHVSGGTKDLPESSPRRDERDAI